MLAPQEGEFRVILEALEIITPIIGPQGETSEV